MLIWFGGGSNAAVAAAKVNFGTSYLVLLQPLSMELYLTAFAFVCSWECIVIVPGLELIELVATVRLCSEKDTQATINYSRVYIQR